VDAKRVFVGSFNFDLRSARLNTEMGLIVESEGLAGRIRDAFEQRIPQAAYEVRLSDKGDLYWIERRGGELVRRDIEPGTSVWERNVVRFLSLFDIDWLL
jgi:cardiolipin synthase C